MVDAKGEPTAFGKALVEEVPEIAGKRPGLEADAALMDGFGRTLKRVIQEEDAVPRTTTVTQKPIVDALESLKAEYEQYGNPKTSGALDKLITTWKEMPSQIPWERFRDAKRAFFNEANTKSAAMRRAYGILMEAASPVSKGLAAANKSYSVVRRALDAANIDIKTGRRIMNVGKADKPTMSGAMDEALRRLKKKRLPAI